MFYVSEMRGVYCLIFELNKEVIVEVGALGKIKFKKGRYVYVGSHQKNIEKRIGR